MKLPPPAIALRVPPTAKARKRKIVEEKFIREFLHVISDLLFSPLPPASRTATGQTEGIS
jgi:hypothetical protein